MATIPYSDVIDRQLLPVDAQNIVTRARLVIAGDKAGEEPTSVNVLISEPGVATLDAYAPNPIVFEYEAPEHVTYAASKSFSLPSGVNPFLPPTDLIIPEPSGSGWDNPGVPSAVRDGDPSTFATTTGVGGSQSWLEYFDWFMPTRIHGWRLVYETVNLAPAELARLRVGFTTEVEYDRAPLAGSKVRTVIAEWRSLPASPSDGGTVDLYAVLPSDAGYSPDNDPAPQLVPLRTGMGLIAPNVVDDPTGTVRVYAFYPLVLNEALLEDIARAQIRLPAQLPQRITVKGYVAPDREHTITGWPGGDYTGVVAQHQYELGRTIIDFEQAGSPAGLPAEAIEAARERQQAIDGTVRVANYNLMMGSRR